jgi:hypothetical protein
MSIRVSLFTILVKGSALEARFPGGRAGFLAMYPEAGHDEKLFVLRAMSGGDLHFIVTRLEWFGLRLGQDIAIGEGVHGEWTPAPGVVFSGHAWDWHAELDSSADCAAPVAQDEPGSSTEPGSGPIEDQEAK